MEKNELRLRPYKCCDAKTIVTWCKDEVSFRKWSSDRWESFPITEADMNRKYMDYNGDCADMDNFYPMTAFEIIKAGKVTLGVFDNNMPAYYCYKSVGFKDVKMDKEVECEICGETWNILELEIEKR